MQQLVIHGGKKLSGTVQISGAKNAALPLMTASLLASGKHTFTNVPQLKDVQTMQHLLEHLGTRFDVTPKTTTIDTSGIQHSEAPYEQVKTMRASVLVLGPLVARWRKAKVSLPGGCAIGARPINLHLKALAQMGADIAQREGYIIASAKQLKGVPIVFDKVTVTGTENILMAATLAEGTTVLENAAREPEVVDLANYLIKMGAKIHGAGTERVEIEGIRELKPATHTVIADRIETATYLMAGAITGGSVTTVGCPSTFLEAPLTKLKEAGCKITAGADSIHLQAPERLHSIDITTAPFPGLATDVQAQFMSLMTVADGTSIITETIFENRFQHALELMRLGANIKIEGHTAVVRGVPQLSGAPLMATDLRASASLVLAGLIAQNTTIVDRTYHLNRGYEDIVGKLSRLGADIHRKNA